MKTRVLILCTGNSARSQMAEGLLRHMAGDRMEVHSAGIRPGSVRPEAIEALAELGIDIRGQWSKHVDDFAGQPFDYAITVCDHAKESCPVFPAQTRRIHWTLDDPAAATGDETHRLDEFRRIRDQISQRLTEFVGSLGAKCGQHQDGPKRVPTAGVTSRKKQRAARNAKRT